MLGNTLEAKAELAKISPPGRDHPAALEVRWQICAAAKEWKQCLEIAEAIVTRAPEQPFGWIHQAFALHELKRTEEAYQLLAPLARKFPKESIIPYNLACYTCQLQRLPEARRWLKKAVQVGGARHIKELAANDPDLEPLRQDVEKL